MTTRLAGGVNGTNPPIQGRGTTPKDTRSPQSPGTPRRVPAPPATPCNGLHGLFDSIDPIDHDYARNLCASCPVIDACRRLLEDVRAVGGQAGKPEGTWAGQLLVDGEPYKPRRIRPRMSPADIAAEDARYSKWDAATAHREYKNGMRSEWINAGERVWQRMKKREERARARRRRGAA